MKTTLEILIAHSRWRKGELLSIHFNTTQAEISGAIDDAIAALVERSIARAAAVQMAGEIQRFRDGMAKATGFRK